MKLGGSAGGLALLALAAGCAADSQPAVLPPLPAPPPASAPATPAAARSPNLLVVAPSEGTPAGAEAFVKHYLTVVNQGSLAGDGKRIAALSDAGCGGCQNLIGSIESKRFARKVGGDFTQVQATSPPLLGGEVIVHISFAITERKIYQPANTLVRTIPGEAGLSAQLRLAWTASDYRVLGFRTITP